MPAGIDLELLLIQIADMHERAYRRGFQQGFAAGLKGAPSDQKAIAKWRFGAVESPNPPGMVPGGCTALQRLRIETSIDSDSEIFILLSE